LEVISIFLEYRIALSLVIFTGFFISAAVGFIVFRSLVNQLRLYFDRDTRRISSKTAFGTILIFTIIPSLAIGFSSVPDTEIRFEDGSHAIEGSVFSAREKIGEIEENEVSLNPNNVGESARFEYSSRGVNYEHSIDSESFKAGEEIILPKNKSGNYLLHFYVENQNQAIKGKIHQNGEKIADLNKTGYTWISSKSIENGEFYLLGEINSTSYNFTFEFSDEDNHFKKEFYVPESEWNNEILGEAANLNLKELRENTKRFINDARKENHPEELPSNESGAEFSYFYNPIEIEFSESLNEDAQAKAEEMRKEEYFSHSSPKGVGVGGRMKDKEIGYLMVAEDLTGVSNISYDTSERTVARAAIENFLGSPSHRSSIVDRDDLYTDLGAGYDCEGDNCIVAVVLAKMKRYSNANLEEEYCWKIPIHEQGLGIDYPINTEISMKSTGSLDTHLVPKGEEYNECVNSDPIDSVEEWDHISKLDHETETKPGYHLIMKSNTDANTSVKIDYTN